MDLTSTSFLFSLLLLLVSLLLLKKRRSGRGARATLPPGPSKLPILGSLHHLLGGLPHRSLTALSKKFGPVILLKLGEVPTLVVSSAEAAAEIMKTHDISFASRPTNLNLQSATYGDRGELRKMSIVELLSAKRVQSFRFIREEEVLNLVRSIVQLSNAGSRSVIGSKCKYQKDFIRIVMQTLEAAGGFSLADLFPSTEKKPAEQPEEEEDLVDVMLRVQAEGSLSFPLADEDMKAMMLTSAGIMEWAMSELMRNPRVMRRLQEEVRETVGGKGKVTENDINGMNYLRLVIKETLRLHPPVPLLLPRECRETCEVLGYRIPEKTRVFVNVWALGRDPRHWDNATEFEPERFERRNSMVDFKEPTSSSYLSGQAEGYAQGCRLSFPWLAFSTTLTGSSQREMKDAPGVGHERDLLDYVPEEVGPLPACHPSVVSSLSLSSSSSSGQHSAQDEHRGAIECQASQSFRFIREEEVLNLVRSIVQLSNAGSSVNLSRKLVLLANDIGSRSVIGSKCKYQKDFIRIVMQTLEAAGGFSLADLFPSWPIIKLLSGASFKMQRLHRDMDAILNSIIEDRREKKPAEQQEEEEDLVDVMLRVQAEGSLSFPLADEDMKAMMLDMLGGASETSAGIMEWAMSELMRNPRVMRRLQKEGRRLSEEREGDGERHQRNELLETGHQGDSEAAPSCSSAAPRVPGRARFLVTGYQRRRVFVNVWALGRDPRHWDNATEFEPERFERRNSMVDFKGTNFEFLPFRAGRRICPGMSFGLKSIELSWLALSTALIGSSQREMKDDAQELDMSETFSITCRRKSDLCLRAIPLSSSSCLSLSFSSSSDSIVTELCYTSYEVLI
ncbi:cytochrome P450, partial [Musa troglodytarum]